MRTLEKIVWNSALKRVGTRQPVDSSARTLRGVLASVLDHTILQSCTPHNSHYALRVRMLFLLLSICEMPTHQIHKEGQINSRFWMSGYVEKQALSSDRNYSC